jgi:hypothetical protein
VGAVYCALVHHPVRDREGRTVTSAVTTLDVHDIARSCRTYGVAGYFVVTPIEAQQVLVNRILEHWRTGAGKTRMPERSEALSICRVSASLADVLVAISEREGRAPITYTTAARAMAAKPTMTYAAAGAAMASQSGPSLVLFGTGHGLATEVLEMADVGIEPIAGRAGFNHLSVRSAVAISLDRLLGSPATPSHNQGG